MILLVVGAGAAAAAAWLAIPPPAEARLRRLRGTVTGPGLRERLTQLVRRRGLRSRSRRRAARLRVVHGLAALAAELEAGQAPVAALAQCAGSPSLWPHAERAALRGESIPEALERDAVSAPALARLAACWRAAADSGAGLAASVERIAASARADEDVHWALEAELSGPRATARTLALLPVLGIGLGMLLGSDPLGWLVGTGPGHLCLIAGAAMSAVGVWWTRRIARSVEMLL